MLFFVLFGYFVPFCGKESIFNKVYCNFKKKKKVNFSWLNILCLSYDYQALGDIIIGDGNGQKNNTLLLIDWRWLRVETDLWMQMVCFPSLFPIDFLKKL